jgi:hypothetical protein
MKITRAFYILFAVVVIIVIGGILVISKLNTAVEKSVSPTAQFAQCLGSKGAVFYGAFWCPHCQNQKKEFGRDAKYLPYVECSTPDSQKQTQICKDKNIEGYPTWEFADGTREEGEISWEILSEKTGCPLPQ